MARAAGPKGAEHRRLADAIAAECGAAPMPDQARLDPTDRHGDRLDVGQPAMHLIVLGGLALRLRGEWVPLDRLRPKARSILAMLAASTGEAVHRDTICAAMWPDADPDAARRRLQVAVSAIRRLVEPDAARGEAQVMIRVGDGYALRLPPGHESDLARFERAARAASGSAGSQDTWVQALAAYGGDLLPSEGDAEWVLPLRDRLRSEAVRVATRLAEHRLAAGDHPGAVEASEAGLRIDPYRDPLWQCLIEATAASGDQAAHAQARRRYRAVLAELGVVPADEG
jgi:DNA-binding SARP family transcriptional activator